MWNGAEDDLKPSPTSSIASPATSSASWGRAAAAMRSKLSSPVEPYTSAEPNKRIAEPNEPTIRYFSPASSEPTMSLSIAHMM